MPLRVLPEVLHLAPVDFRLFHLSWVGVPALALHLPYAMMIPISLGHEVVSLEIKWGSSGLITFLLEPLSPSPGPDFACKRLLSVEQRTPTLLFFLQCSFYLSVFRHFMTSDVFSLHPNYISIGGIGSCLAFPPELPSRVFGFFLTLAFSF